MKLRQARKIVSLQSKHCRIGTFCIAVRRVSRAVRKKNKDWGVSVMVPILIRLRELQSWSDFTMKSFSMCGLPLNLVRGDSSAYNYSSARIDAKAWKGGE